jgi:hypothetical protein
VAEIFAVVNVAVPPVAKFPAGTPTTGAVPKRVAPAKNETVPPGALPKLDVLTEAVKLKFVFARTLGGKVVMVEDVGPGVMVNGTTAELLAL